MCTILADDIITFNVSGVSIKITTEKLSKHPESSLTTMVNNKVQPSEGFFIECCPKIFGYILRFVLNDIKINPILIANKLGASEGQIRKIIDSFNFKNIYLEPVKDIWTVAWNGDLEQLKRWLDSGIDPNIIRNDDRGETYTPLICAIRNKKLECVKLLIQYKADVNCKDSVGNDALYHAIRRNNLDIVKELIANGCDVTMRYQFGDTNLSSAVTEGFLDIVRELIRAGANVDNQNINGLSPLHLASNRGYLEIVRELIRNKANIDIQNNEGRTPLFSTFTCRNTEIIKEVFDNRITPEELERNNLLIFEELIKNGANVNIQNKDGNTPLHQASICNSLERVCLLIKSGANTKSKNNEGDIPLVVALKHGHYDIAKELTSVYS